VRKIKALYPGVHNRVTLATWAHRNGLAKSQAPSEPPQAP
jgi:hypothetical protein